MLDALHDAGIEIVSPSFLNQGIFDADCNFIPDSYPRNAKDLEATPVGGGEAVMFPRALKAADRQRLIELLYINNRQISDLNKSARLDLNWIVA